MFTLFETPLSAVVGATTAYFGGKMLGYGPGLTLSNPLMQMSALGNAILTYAAGNKLEQFSLYYSVLMSSKDAYNNSPVSLRLKNTVLAGGVMAARESLGALIGFSLFTLAGLETGVSLPTFLFIEGVGSGILASAIPILAQLTKTTVGTVGPAIVNILAENANDIFRPRQDPFK